MRGTEDAGMGVYLADETVLEDCGAAEEAEARSEFVGVGVGVACAGGADDGCCTPADCSAVFDLPHTSVKKFTYPRQPTQATTYPEPLTAIAPPTLPPTVAPTTTTAIRTNIQKFRRRMPSIVACSART